jgi:hypothetical protein
MAQPMITSSTSSCSIASFMAKNSLITAAVNSSERQLRVVPFFDLPTAVLKAATITASRVIESLSYIVHI